GSKRDWSSDVCSSDLADPHELVEVVESGGVLRIVGGLELRAVPRAIEHGLDELPDVRDGVLASRVIASVQLGAELVEEPDEPGDRLDGPRGQQRYLPLRSVSQRLGEPDP